MKSFLYLFYLLLPSIGSGSTPRIDLHEALQLALSKSPEYQSLLLKERNSSLQAKNAWALLFPTIDLQALHQYGDRSSGVNSGSESLSTTHLPWATQAGITISENLYDNGETWRNTKIAELNVQLQHLLSLSGRSKVLIQIAKAFYDYSLASATYQLQEEQLQLLQVQFSSIESRYHQGLSSNRDYLRSKAQIHSAEVENLTQKLQIDEMKSKLRELLGTFEALDFRPVVPKNFASFDLNKGQNTLFPPLSDTLPYRIAELQSQISELKHQSATRAELPRLGLQGSYNYVMPQYMGSRISGVDDPYWNLKLSLVLDYRLWDWGTSQRNVAIASNQRMIDEKSQDSARLKARHDLDALKKQELILNSSARLIQQILKARQEAYASLSRAYRDGKASYLELITALNDLFGSRNQEIGLRFSLLKLKLDLAYYEGNVDEVLEIH